MIRRLPLEQLAAVSALALLVLDTTLFREVGLLPLGLNSTGGLVAASLPHYGPMWPPRPPFCAGLGPLVTVYNKIIVMS